MEIRHPEVGICGLSCRLCPHHHTDAESRCGGCKSESRMAVGCPFITCAVKRRGIEFCWECDENDSCERWAGHREFGRTRDTFVCYASLDENIAAIGRAGLDAFVEEQSEREQLLIEMIAEFNEGRSKTYYSIAATLLPPSELLSALESARGSCDGMDVREKAKVLHALLDAVADARGLKLALRK
jgi:hypothetical protein